MAETTSRRGFLTKWRLRNPADKAAREHEVKDAEAALGAITSALASVVECSKRVRQAQREQEEVQSARERLQTEPDDSDACLAVGRWTCFSQGDWEAGLKLLAKGSDRALKSLAAKELAAKPSEAEDLVAQGDLWWDLAALHKHRGGLGGACNRTSAITRFLYRI